MKLPQTLRDLRKQYGFNSSNVWTTTNPKTLKNGKVSNRPTIVLHLAPLLFGVCSAAGSCAALCLNRAGNPAYLAGKLSRREKRSHAWHYHREAFLQLCLLEAARLAHKGFVGARPNGTADNKYESEEVTVTPELSAYIHTHFDRYIPPMKYTFISALIILGLQPYDYTKRVDRDFHRARKVGYHLTLSWGGKHDSEIFSVAKRHGLNVAAPVYGIKKSAAIPAQITAPASAGGGTFATLDGDITDWRRDDPSGQVRIVALRLKRTPNQTEHLARQFCIA